MSATSLRNLDEIWEYIAERFDEEGASHFIKLIVKDCDDLRLAPHRGVIRREFGADLRIIGGANGRVSIAFRIYGETVTIVSVRYAGWRWKRADLR